MHRQQGKGGGSKVDAPMLTAMMKAATNPQKLLQLVRQHAADFDHIHLSAAYTQAVRVWARWSSKTATSSNSAAAAALRAAPSGSAAAAAVWRQGARHHHLVMR